MSYCLLMAWFKMFFPVMCTTYKVIVNEDNLIACFVISLHIKFFLNNSKSHVTSYLRVPVQPLGSPQPRWWSSPSPCVLSPDARWQTRVGWRFLWLHPDRHDWRDHPVHDTNKPSYKTAVQAKAAMCLRAPVTFPPASSSSCCCL